MFRVAGFGSVALFVRLYKENGLVNKDAPWRALGLIQGMALLRGPEERLTEQHRGVEGLQPSEEGRERAMEPPDIPTPNT